MPVIITPPIETTQINSRQFVNNFSMVLEGNLSGITTTLPISNDDQNTLDLLLPYSTPFYSRLTLTIVSTSDPTIFEIIEVGNTDDTNVKITAHSLEGTTTHLFTSGDTVEARLTKHVLEIFRDTMDQNNIRSELNRIDLQSRPLIDEYLTTQNGDSMVNSYGNLLSL